MSNLNTFLRVMNKMGYPNPSTKSIANSIDYDLDNFLPDLVEEETIELPVKVKAKKIIK